MILAFVCKGSLRLDFSREYSVWLSLCCNDSLRLFHTADDSFKDFSPSAPKSLDQRCVGKENTDKSLQWSVLPGLAEGLTGI